jgi:hypothetical protein
MKKTLLLTSALVSSIALTSVANAEVKGSMKFGYGASDGASNDSTAAGTQGFMRETQIDMSTTGDLDNGWSYKANAAFEAEADSIDHSEGTYIELSSGDTLVHFGMDGFTNLDASATPTTGSALQTVADVAGNVSYTRNPTSPYGSFGVGVAQKTPFGTISALYVPQQNDNGKSSGTGDHLATNIEGGAAYEIKFAGNLGMDGLNVVAGLNSRDKETNDDVVTSDGEGKVIGISYNFGSFAIGASKMEDDKQTGTNYDNTEYGVTFAASDKVSIGLGILKHEDSSATSDEETKLLTVGYSLGPIALELNYVDVENHGTTTNKDVTGASINTSVKF